MDVERPFVKKPLVPKKRNNPPKVPNKRFAMQNSLFNPMRHVLDAEPPEAEVDDVEEHIVYGAQNQDSGGPEPESRP
jgi:hypothetical protein